MITTFLHSLETILGNQYYLLTILACTFSFKIFLLIYLLTRSLSASKNSHRSIWLLCGVLIGASVVDSAWIVELISRLFLPNMDSTLWVRIAWAFPVIQYQSLALFIESFVEPQYKITLRRAIFLLLSAFFVVAFLSEAFVSWHTGVKSIILYNLQRICSLYCLFPLIMPSLFYVYWQLRNKQLPRLLKKQLSIIIRAFIIPHLFFDFIQVYPFNFVIPSYITSSYAAVGLSNLLLAYAIYYCSRRVTGLRFLNLNDHVQAAARFNFVNNFKDVLEQLSMVTNPKELSHITQTFFKENFNTPVNRTLLYTRAKQAVNGESNGENNRVEMVIETFLATQSAAVEVLKNKEILITDELDFTNFYDEEETQKTLLNLLEALNADVFIPLYKNNILIAYIIIDRYARNNNFYSKVEQDEMLVFANYVGNIIYLLQNRKLEALLAHEKELKEELYSKHQEINQYKESIRSFLRSNKQKEIGISFTKVAALLLAIKQHKN